jgi:VTC domain
MNPLPGIDTFQAISLKELEATADMLVRLDNKYIVHNPLSPEGIEKLRTVFNILTIGSRTSFGYHNVYFDEQGLCFKQHTQEKRKKFKARTRRYLDSTNLAFFEVKLSGKRSQTNKYRLRCDVSEHGTMTHAFETFLKDAYRTQYKKEFAHTLTPTVTTAYKRMTLVAKEGGERLTIDYNLVYTVDGKEVSMPTNIAIFETKSINGNGIADKILRSESIRTASGCSKFCIAMALSGTVPRYNKFRPVIRKHFMQYQQPTASLRQNGG